MIVQSENQNPYHHELRSLGLNARQALHLVAHLQRLSFWGRLRLFLGGIRPAEITRQLRRPGSRFFPEFASSPDRLLHRIANQAVSLKVRINWKEDSGNLRVRFSETDYPRGIGGDGVVSLAELDESAMKTLTKREVTGTSLAVPVVTLETLPPTWWANMFLRRRNDRVRVSTIFPGTNAPPFPEKDILPPQVFSEAKVFWETHALVEIPSPSGAFSA